MKRSAVPKLFFLLGIGLALAGCMAPYRSSTLATGPVKGDATVGFRFLFYVSDLQKNEQGGWEEAYRHGDKADVIDAKAFMFWVDHGNSVGSPPVQSFHIIRLEITRDGQPVDFKPIPVKRLNAVPGPSVIVRGIEYWLPSSTDVTQKELPELKAGHYSIKIHYEMEGKEYDISLEADYSHGTQWEKIWEKPVC